MHERTWVSHAASRMQRSSFPNQAAGCSPTNRPCQIFADPGRPFLQLRSRVSAARWISKRRLARFQVPILHGHFLSLCFLVVSFKKCSCVAILSLFAVLTALSPCAYAVSQNGTLALTLILLHISSLFLLLSSHLADYFNSAIPAIGSLF